MDFDKEIENQRLKYDLQENRVSFNCTRCNSEIYNGEDYFIYERSKICEECFDEIQNDEKFNSKRIAGDDNDY